MSICGRGSGSSLTRRRLVAGAAGGVAAVTLSNRFGARAQDATPQAAACAGRAGKFWEMHDRLFDDRQRLGAADIAAKARRLSLDDGFERCLTEETAREEVERDMAEARALSIAATPTVLVGRPDDSGSVRVTHRFGAIPFSQLAAAIDDLLSGAAAHKTGA